MHESPSVDELLRGVTDFLTEIAIPELSGQAQFQARVSANALALVRREIALKQTSDNRAIALYRDLLNNTSGDLVALEARLCEAILRGYMDVSTPGLLPALRGVTAAQISVDQPAYRDHKPQ